MMKTTACSLYIRFLLFLRRPWIRVDYGTGKRVAFKTGGLVEQESAEESRHRRFLRQVRRMGSMFDNRHQILTGQRTLVTVAPLFHCCKQSSRLPAM